DTSPIVDAGLDAEAIDILAQPLQFDQRGAGFFRISPVDIGAVEIPQFDFGDAPDTYGTLDGSNGANHVPLGPTLGAARDAELDAQGALDGTGDDATSLDDEDG